MNNWLRDHWPHITMTASIPTGYALGLLALYAAQPTNELTADLIRGAIMFGTIVAVFAALAATSYRSQVAAPRHIWVWVVVLAIAAAVVLIL